MLIYWLMFTSLLPGAMGWRGPTKGQRIGFSLVCLVFVVAIGLRDHVGMDWNNYILKFAAAKSKSFESVVPSTEVGFEVLNWWFANNGHEIYSLNLIAAILLCVGVFSYAWTTKNPWLALTAVTPYLMIVIGMSALRQSAALGIFLFMLSRWGTLGLLMKVALATAAFSFHASAFFIYVVIFYESNLRREFRIPLLMIFGALAVSYAVQSDWGDTYRVIYVEYNLNSPGALAHIALSAIPAAIYFSARSRFDAVDRFDDLWRLLAVLSLVAVPAILISSTGASRFALYFAAVQMKVFAALPLSLSGQVSGAGLRVALISISGFILFLWLNFANSAFAWSRYSNILFAFGP